MDIPYFPISQFLDPNHGYPSKIKKDAAFTFIVKEISFSIYRSIAMFISPKAKKNLQENKPELIIAYSAPLSEKFVKVSLIRLASGKSIIVDSDNYFSYQLLFTLLENSDFDRFFNKKPPSRKTKFYLSFQSLASVSLPLCEKLVCFYNSKSLTFPQHLLNIFWEKLLKTISTIQMDIIQEEFLRDLFKGKIKEFDSSILDFLAKIEIRSEIRDFISKSDPSVKFVPVTRGVSLLRPKGKEKKTKETENGAALQTISQLSNEVSKLKVVEGSQIPIIIGKLKSEVMLLSNQASSSQVSSGRGSDFSKQFKMQQKKISELSTRINELKLENVMLKSKVREIGRDGFDTKSKEEDRSTAKGKSSEWKIKTQKSEVNQDKSKAQGLFDALENDKQSDSDVFVAKSSKNGLKQGSEKETKKDSPQSSGSSYSSYSSDKVQAKEKHSPDQFDLIETLSKKSHEKQPSQENPSKPLISDGYSDSFSEDNKKKEVQENPIHQKIAPSISTPEGDSDSSSGPAQNKIYPEPSDFQLEQQISQESPSKIPASEGYSDSLPKEKKNSPKVSTGGSHSDSGSSYSGETH